jgi:hypothetical protein
VPLQIKSFVDLICIMYNSLKKRVTKEREENVPKRRTQKGKNILGLNGHSGKS